METGGNFMETILSREEAVNIKALEQCPCGSGKVFKDCCKKKDYKYHTLGINYENREILFNHTKVMENYDNIAQYALDNIFSLNGQPILALSKALDILKELYKKIDEGIDSFSQYAPCRKGCSSCCHLYLECTDIEAEFVRRYIKRNRTSKEIEELNNKIHNMLREMETTARPHTLEEDSLQDMYLNYAAKKNPCIFLNEEGGCSIYEARPLSCRKFIVFTSRENCSISDKIVTPALPPANIGTLAIENLSLVVGRYKSLNYEERKAMKPIKRCFIQWFKNGFEDINRQP